MEGISLYTLAGGSVLLESRPDDVSIDMNQLSQRRQQQQMLNEHYIQQRAETMENIESTIVELGVIFKQLAEMVKDQEEQVERYTQQLPPIYTYCKSVH